MISFLNSKVTKISKYVCSVHANEYVNMKKVTEGYPVDYYVLFWQGRGDDCLVCSIVPLVIVGLCYFYNLKTIKCFFKIWQQNQPL